MFHAYKTAAWGDAISVGMKPTLCVLLVACGSSSSQPVLQPAPQPALHPVANTAVPPVASKKFEPIAAAVERDAPKTTSVLVMQRGVVVYEQYFNGADAETLHDTRSVGKSFTTRRCSGTSRT
jgi:CubicO group peptidase (beta-lactamase class C family)